MNTTAEILHAVNELRARGNKPIIKSWKGKKEALLNMLTELQSKFKTKHTSELATWCRENGLNPKTARQRLRSRGLDRNLDNLLIILGKK